MPEPQRILILSIKAGAGHLRAAEALQKVLGEKYPSMEVRHIESLTLTNVAFQRAFTATYNKLAMDLPSVWGMIYEGMEKHKPDSGLKKLAAFFDRANARPLVKACREFAPDRIICTHYLPAEIIGEEHKKGKLSAPIFITLTDYDIHTMWIQDGADHYFVATEEMAFGLREKGIGDASVHVTGIPLMPVFAQHYPSRKDMRRQLGLNPDAVTILVSAGGFGFGGVDETVARLADLPYNLQVLAVAGRNEKLENAIGKVAETRQGRVVPFGFVTNMHELMASSDFAVTKPGGLTSSECMALGLPMVIIQPIPGQEERNANYLLEQGVAWRANSPAHLAYKVQTLLARPEELARMAAAAIRIRRPRAAYDIADIVMQG
jgi:processive 1,2-diacylglycerol beta-glucosyltransferase